MSNAPTTRAKAIDVMCRGCIVDPMTGGTWREQVACCVSADCPLFPFRPLPRHCTTDGYHDLPAIAAVRAKVERIDRGSQARA